MDIFGPGDLRTGRLRGWSDSDEGVPCLGEIDGTAVSCGTAMDCFRIFLFNEQR